MNITNDFLLKINKNSEPLVLVNGYNFLVPNNKFNNYVYFHSKIDGPITFMDEFTFIIYYSLKNKYKVNNNYKDIIMDFSKKEEIKEYLTYANKDKKYLKEKILSMIEKTQLLVPYDNLTFNGVKIKSNITYFNDIETNTENSKELNDLLKKEIKWFNKKIPLSKYTKEFIHLDSIQSMILSIIHHYDNQEIFTLEKLHNKLFPIIVDFNDADINLILSNEQDILKMHIQTKQTIELTLWYLIKNNLITIYE